MPAKYGIIFDVDGIIADTEAVNAAASIQMFEELFDLKGVLRADFEAGLGRGAAAYVRAAAAVHGLELSDTDIHKATQRRQENFLRMLRENPLPAFPGVLELMNTTRTHPDFDLAIATSSTREKSQAVLESARIPYSTMIYITGSDVTHKKPHPELFQKAVARLGIPAHYCVVIEDAPNGVAAAIAAGCRTIAVTNSISVEKLHQADLIEASLLQVGLQTIVDLCSKKQTL